MFNATRLKVQLKLSINRLKMLQAKKTSLNQQQRKDIATLIEKGKIESARVRVEHVIRDDLMIEAMESLELYCDLLLARFGLLETYKTCEASIAEAVNTIIWAAPRLSEVKELSLARDQMASKFGKDFTLEAVENKDEQVNPKIVMKLQVSTPDSYLVELYLEEIARTYKISWRSNIIDHPDDKVEEERIPSDNEEENITQNEDASDIPLDLPQIPSNAPLKKTILDTSDPNDFDALAKRLNALKKK